MTKKIATDIVKTNDTGEVSSLNFNVDCLKVRSQQKCAAQMLLHVTVTLLNLTMDFAISRQPKQFNVAALINSEHKLFNMLYRRTEKAAAHCLNEPLLCAASYGVSV